MADPNAFYSSMAQVGASLAGLTGAFIVARIITISGARKGLQDELTNFDRRQGVVIGHSLNWLLHKQRDDGSWDESVAATSRAISTLQSLSQFADSDRVQRAIDGGLKWLELQQFSDGGWGDSPHVADTINTAQATNTLLEVAKERRQISSELARQYLPKSAIWGLAALGYLLASGVLLPLTMMIIPNLEHSIVIWVTFALFMTGILSVCTYLAREISRLSRPSMKEY